MVLPTLPPVYLQSSVAFQLLVEVYVFPHVPAVVVAPRSCTVAPPHVSEAVGAVNVGEAGHSTEIGRASCRERGGVWFATVMVLVTVPLVLPQSSVAFQLVVELYVFPHVP